MQSAKHRSLVLTLVFGLAACSGGGPNASTSAAGLPAVNGPPLGAFTLQFAVGTATLASSNGTFFTGLNTVSTFRQPNGLSATTSNTPSITAPTGMILYNGSNVISGITIAQIANLATLKATDPNIYTDTAQPLYGFGPLIGAFGYGLQPANLLPQASTTAVYGGQNCAGIYTSPGATLGFGGVTGYASLRFNTFSLPFYGQSNDVGCGLYGGTPIAESAVYGGPPAWPSPIGYSLPPGFNGYPLGFTDFALAPVPGTYRMNVTFPSSNDGSTYANYGASSTLTPSAIANALPGFAAPSLAVQADGSAFVNVNVPSGVSEAIVLVTRLPCNHGGTQKLNFSMITHQTGPQTLVLSNQFGPPDSGGHPSHTFCTRSEEPPGPAASEGASVQAIGFDYPAFEASYPQNTSITPAITTGDGHGGNADLTASVPVNISYQVSGG